MLEFVGGNCVLVGPAGSLAVPPQDVITRKLMMIYEGECCPAGPLAAARKYGYSKQRYYQLRKAYKERGGALALQNLPRGPKTNYRRTEVVVRQVIAHRFMDPDASTAVIAQKLRQADLAVSTRSVERVVESFALQKKLYKYRPDREGLEVEADRTKTLRRQVPADARSIERGVRQLLADKVSGSMVGIWLLAPEHLRLHTFDLLCGWTGQPATEVEPRLALQLVHEAALCVTGVREGRCLSQKGFELANGLPFVASDRAIHELLAAHTVAEAEGLQVALGRLRRASGHFPGRLLAIDPHRIRSWTKRQSRRHRHKPGTEAVKAAQTFFCLDTESAQPICFTSGTSARTAGRATPGLLALADDILCPKPHQCLVLADAEHFSAEILAHAHSNTPFDLLVPVPAQAAIIARMRGLPDEAFTRHWAGYATAKTIHEFTRHPHGSFPLFVQREGERPEDYRFNGFLCTTDRDELQALTRHYPGRWHVEEFFNLDQDIGWARAGTQNLNIRYGQMTLALIAQAAIHQLRARLGPTAANWNAAHLANAIFRGIEGDIRVRGDTVLVTFYNAPEPGLLRQHYEGLPQKLQAEGIDPRIPWLCGLKLDFALR